MCFSISTQISLFSFSIITQDKCNFIQHQNDPEQEQILADSHGPEPDPTDYHDREEMESNQNDQNSHTNGPVKYFTSNYTFQL